MQIDHPYLRRCLTCPVCGGSKDRGAVACWPCYRLGAARAGNPDFEARLDEVEMQMMAGPKGWTVAETSTEICS